MHERLDAQPHAFQHVPRMDRPLSPHTGTKQCHRAGSTRLDGPLLEVEKAVIHTDQIGDDLRASPRPQAVTVSDGRPGHHEGRASFSNPAKQARSHGQVVPGEVEEDEMAAVVDLWIDIKVGQTRTKGPDIGRSVIEHLTFTKHVLDDHQGQPQVGVHRASCLAREGLDARDVAAKNEVVDVVSAFVSFH